MEDNDRDAPPLTLTAAASARNRGKAASLYSDTDILGSSQYGGGGYMVQAGNLGAQEVNNQQGGGYMVQAGNLGAQEVNNQQGGGYMVPAGNLGAQEVNNQQGDGLTTLAIMPQRQERQPFSSAHVAFLHKSNRYHDLENYVVGYLPKEETWSTHPWLVLQIRRAWVLTYLACDLFDEAKKYFVENILGPFQPILQLDQDMVRNADLADLNQEINFINSCLVDRVCHYHPYNTNGMLSKLITDYMMLYVPSTCFPAGSRKLKAGYWQFAFEIWRENRRPTFRCLVCTMHLFKSGTIGLIVPHLKNECTGPKMTPYLMDKYQQLELQIFPLAEPAFLARLRCQIDPASGQISYGTKARPPHGIPQRQPTATFLPQIPGHQPGHKRFRADDTEGDPRGKLAIIFQRITKEVKRAEVLTDNVGAIHTEMKQVVQNVKVFLTEAEAAAGTASASRSQAHESATAMQNQLAVQRTQAPSSTSHAATFHPSTVQNLYNQQQAQAFACYSQANEEARASESQLAALSTPVTTQSASQNVLFQTALHPSTGTASASRLEAHENAFARQSQLALPRQSTSHTSRFQTALHSSTVQDLYDQQQAEAHPEATKAGDDIVGPPTSHQPFDQDFLYYDQQAYSEATKAGDDTAGPSTSHSPFDQDFLYQPYELHDWDNFNQ